MENVKEMVRQKYSDIALQDKNTNATSCCGSGCCSTEVYEIMSDEYSDIAGYNPDADLGLGCGLPTVFAQIKKGDTVVDLGSGAGNDAFIARHETGDRGKVIGIDFTDAMIQLARKNTTARGFNNVEFVQADIEKISLGDDIADVVISNCVLNLIPNKKAALKEIFRILKPGGRFSISDIVLEGELPTQVKDAAEMSAGCVAGAIQKQDYLDIIRLNGFINVSIQKDKPINIPDDILANYLSAQEITLFRESGTGIYSITVYAEKPESQACCGTDCCS